jgi:hypothetical protein
MILNLVPVPLQILTSYNSIENQDVIILNGSLMSFHADCPKTTLEAFVINGRQSWFHALNTLISRN